MNKNSHPIIFIHVPKTAGRSFIKIIKRQYKNKNTFQINPTAVSQSTKHFQTLSQKKRYKYKCLLGHMQYGLHQYMTPETKYISFIRNPVDRIISHYYYVIRTPEHYLYSYIQKNIVSLKDYISLNSYSELTNGQVRDISGLSSNDDHALNVALKNINSNFQFVGLTEYFDESLIIFQKQLNWKNIIYIKQNVSTNKPLKENIPEEILETIRQNNQLDLILYESVKQKFLDYLYSNNHWITPLLEKHRKTNQRLKTIGSILIRNQKN